ncbi:hypothetical protein BDN71DRAFT_1454205 [Pleurotus eryngii]|uniref:Uncharacterized protein n=1 Tax=Pleurotus eryngii TaxID=5323 RepID=A0A9P5ZME1_PLEER|nr:hypothetical protein BDN71DRAFT_1454205 [Pleurotus eryngii]
MTWHLCYRTIYLFKTYAVCGRSRNDWFILLRDRIEHMRELRINPLDKDVDIVA